MNAKLQNKLLKKMLEIKPNITIGEAGRRLEIIKTALGGAL
jgi:hypothetical protein